MLETMTIQEVRWGLWRGGFHQNGYFLVCKSCDTQSSEREVLEQKWDLEAERSDRLGGKGRKGKQGGTVHNGLIAQFDDSVSKIHPYLIRSHSLWLRIRPSKNILYWIFFRGEYFSGFEYSSGVNIFQGWIFRIRSHNELLRMFGIMYSSSWILWPSSQFPGWQGWWWTQYCLRWFDTRWLPNGYHNVQPASWHY